jgi:hypothetical protein
LINVLRNAFLALALVFAASTQVHAQTTCTANCDVTVGQGFTVQWDAPVTSPTAGPLVGYRLYVDGSKVGADILASAGVREVVNVSVATRGAHSLEVRSYNADRETAAPAIALNAKLAAPGAPTNLRLQIVVTIAENGSVIMKVVGVEVVE